MQGFNKIVKPLATILKIANNSLKNLVMSKDMAKKDELVSGGEFDGMIEILSKS